MKLDVVDIEAKKVGEAEVADEVFGSTVSKGAIYDTIKSYLANQRLGTSSSKTRKEVRGGGAKPWRQKGTGRARAGSTRSPIWRHGGSVFGPKPRDYYYSVPEKVKKRALFSSLSVKMKEGKISLVNDISFENPKTKEVVKILKNLELSGKILIIMREHAPNFEKSARNIDGVRLTLAKDLNCYEVMNFDYLLIFKGALQVLENRIRGQSERILSSTG